MNLDRNQNNMPEGFEPPVPAWAADWSGGPQVLTTGVFGVQGSESKNWKEWVAAHLQVGGAGPQQVEFARFTDQAGLENSVAIAYWTDQRYHTWWNDPAVSDWWHDQARESDGNGFWREIFHVPVNRLETLHSTPNAHGVAALADELEGPVPEHAYPGAMRDRIPDSARTTLSGPAEVKASQLPRADIESVGIWLTPPANLCIIRSGQDWTYCGETETAFYLEKLQPHLQAGMAFLTENPNESRCLSMRLMQMHDEQGEDIQQTFGLGYALDIFAFEEWAKSHPTHLRIFDHFMEHAGAFGEDMKLRLWHEVSVMEGGRGELQYIGCHDKTGLLPYLESGD